MRSHHRPRKGGGARCSAEAKLLPVLAVIAIGVAVLQSSSSPSTGDGSARPTERADTSVSGVTALRDRAALGGRALAQPSGQVAGEVRTRGRAGLPGATVCALMEADGAVGECTVTDADGVFALEGLDVTSGEEVLVAAAPGHLPTRRALAGDLRWPPEHLTLVLEPGGSEVSGVVLDAMGGFVPAASVTLRSGALSTLAVVSSDDEGRFRANVPGG